MSTIHAVGDKLATQFASADPAAWRGKGARITFAPGVITDSIPFTNRPTFQQALEFQK